jgi:hypothetical protein
MRLHTDFHDYYDHAIGYGIDEKIHYNRFTKAVDIKVKASADRPLHHRSGILGFCGTLYPFIHIRRYDKKHDCDYLDDYEGRIIDDYYAFSNDEYRSKEIDWHNYSDDFGYSSDDSRRVKLKQFFIDWGVANDEIFVDLGSPIWMMRFRAHSPNGVVNPCIKDLGFDRIKDSLTAFQEISMYVANVLVEQKPIAMVDDKHRIEQHGFDLKESFRNTKKRS